jgi:K+-transporting ATPase ATPase B chain
MTTVARARPLFDPPLVKVAIKDSFIKLAPWVQWRNPVMFVVLIGSLLTTGLWLAQLSGGLSSEGRPGFVFAITLWLWATLLFANFAESLAEGRGKAQAAALRSSKRDTTARRLPGGRTELPYESVPSSSLKRGDVVLVEAGDTIPGDGEVVKGTALVDESAITGESAPVIREAGGDRSAVTGGTRLQSDMLHIRITANPGEAFIDRMIAMVEGAKRQRTPNEIALAILLAGLTVIFLKTTATLLPFSIYSVATAGHGTPISITVLVALLVCLIPTTIGGLLSAIGIAGMDRMIQAQLASLADETPEGRSIVILAKQQHGIRGRDIAQLGAQFIPFSAQTRMSGVDFEDRRIRKGAADAISQWVTEQGGLLPPELQRDVESVARQGATPLVVADGDRALGVIELKDIVKGGINERFAELRRMGIRTVMITGDNKLTAAAIAAEAGVDDFLAEATPEAKLKLIRDYQAQGRLVAMCGDGTNDAPALAQADVAVAMNTGTQAAKEAGNMVDLDSNPTKLIEVVEVGKQMLITRGSLTTFSIANDVAKYFAIIPAAFATTYPQLNTLNIMHLASPNSAILSAVIFNALIIIALIPLALRGVRYRPVGAEALLRRNLLIYGLGGVIVPFIGIKLIDLVLVALHLI